MSMATTAVLQRTEVLWVIGLAVSGIVNVGAAVRRGGRVKEPQFSIGLALCYLAASGLLAVLLNDDLRGVVRDGLRVGASLATTHLAILFWHRGRRLEKQASQRAGVSATQQLTSAVGIRKVFSGLNDPEIGIEVARIISSSNQATLLVPKANDLFSARSVFSEAVLATSLRNSHLEVLTTSDSISGVHAPDRIQVLRFEGFVTNSWIALCAGSEALFGIPGDEDGRLYSGSASDAIEPRNLPALISRWVAEMASFSRSNRLLAEVKTAHSPRDYKELVLTAEASAESVDRIPKRISVVFKDEATVEAIARTRFGQASPSVPHYIEEHKRRRSQFFASLARGMICREVYSRSDLVRYVTERRHGSVILPKPLIHRTLTLWINAIQTQSNYYVGICGDELPFKYEIVNRSTVILHEAVGISHLNRLNALFLHGSACAKSFSDDFELIWDRVSPAMRDRKMLVSWIERELIPVVSG